MHVPITLPTTTFYMHIGCISWNDLLSAAGDTLAKVFLKAIQASRTLPKEVRVRSQKLKDCLAPLMESFGVAVRVASRLPASDEARSHLLNFFR